jgi:hypothetical protein
LETVLIDTPARSATSLTVALRGRALSLFSSLTDTRDLTEEKFSALPAPADRRPPVTRSGTNTVDFSGV